MDSKRSRSSRKKLIIGLAAAFAAGLVGIQDASAQLLPSPLIPGPLLGSSITYGCQWVQSIDAVNRNTGYPDTYAEYQTSAMPTYLPTTTGTITVSGQYTKARYFNFSSYDGFRPGNLIDAIQDYQLTPRLNGTPVRAPGTNPGPVPDSGNGTYRWEMKLKYEYPPDPPLARDPDTLYMGDTQTRYLGVRFPTVASNRQVGYRVYEPDPGANDLGDVPLPTVTYTAADGTVIDVSNNNPGQAECDRAARGQDTVLTIFPQFVFAGTGNPRFNIIGLTPLRVYPNGGSQLARAPTNVIYADMTIVRFKAQPTPDRSSTPQVRYVSLCQEQNSNTSVVGCIADRDFVTQADGYITTVISPVAKRPAKATAAFGYNFIRWGNAAMTLAYLRQILADPAFPGDYTRARGESGANIDAILGEWSPDISYCDTNTFNTFAEQGGAALIAACKANYRPFINGINRPDPN